MVSGNYLSGTAPSMRGELVVGDGSAFGRLASSVVTLVAGSVFVPGGGPPYFAPPEKVSHPARTMAELSATATNLELVRVTLQKGHTASPGRR